MPPENIFAILGLDEAIQAEIHKIRATSRANLSTLLPQLQQAQQRMDSLLDQDTPDEVIVMAQIETTANLRTEIKQK